jgi:hypothetical protein
MFSPSIDAPGMLHAASTTPIFSLGNQALHRPFVFDVLPRALPSVSRNHAIVCTVGTARSSAHTNNLSQSRTRRLRVRECEILFASSVFGIAWTGSCLRQILALAWSPRQNLVSLAGILASGKFWRWFCGRGGDATNAKMLTPPANLAFWLFGVARWRGSKSVPTGG